MVRFIIQTANNTNEKDGVDLHSNMVRFIINRDQIKITSMEAFTFQYG